MPTPLPHIVSVNTGRLSPLPVGQGRTVPSGIRKMPVTGAVTAGALGLEGDEQADLGVHGGLQKAVYAYPAEHLPFWQEMRQAAGLPPANGHVPTEDTPIALPPGFMGENLLTVGLLEKDIWIGDSLRFEGSDCLLRVTAPREPCYKFTAVMGLPDAARTMVREALCGFYLAVDAPGLLQAGMRITIIPGAREYSIADAIRAKWAKHRNG